MRGASSKQFCSMPGEAGSPGLLPGETVVNCWVRESLRGTRDLSWVQVKVEWLSFYWENRPFQHNGKKTHSDSPPGQ